MPTLDYDTICNIDDPRTRQVVERIRERFLSHYDEDGRDYDKDDIDKNVINSDIFVHRFLINQNGNEETTFEKLKASGDG